MKLVGYIISIIGIICLAMTREQVRKIIGFVLPVFVQNTYFLIGSIVIIIIGIVLIVFSGRSDARSGGEVPIYSGNRIIGYRRV